MKEYIEISAGLLTPMIGVLTLLIYRQQFLVEKLKFRHDLYDRRLAVYQMLMEHLSQILREAKVDQATSLDFSRKTSEAYFLFGKDVGDYLKTVCDRSIDLMGHHRMLFEADLPIGDERSQIAAKQTELLKWFGRQVTDSRQIFSKYLSLA